MKNYRQFVESVGVGRGQASYTPPGAETDAIDAPAPKGVFDLDNPEAIDKLNQYVAAVSARPVMDKWAIIRRLRDKLSIVGFHFAINEYEYFNDEGEEVYEFKLQQFGPRYGFLSDYSGEVTSDDGITPKLGHGLVLEVSCQKTLDGLVKVDAMIVPDGDGIEEEDDMDTDLDYDLDDDEYTD